MDENIIIESSPKKKVKTGVVVLAIVGVIIIVGTVVELIRVLGPNREYTDLDSYLGLETEDQWALLLNGTVTGQYAFVEGENYYLPLEYLTENMDERLYFDTEEEALLYALPEALLIARPGEEFYELGTEEVTLSAPGILERDGEYYISLELLEIVSDCVSDEFADNRIIWLWSDFETEFQTALARKDNIKLRTEASIKGEIVMDLTTEITLYILWEEENYTYCIAENGLMGYVKTQEIEEAEVLIKQREREPYVYTSIQLEEAVRMGWQQVTEYSYTSQTQRLIELAEQSTGLNVICPTWYSISGEDGSVTSLASAEYVQKAHELGISVWATVDNFNSEVNNYNLLSSYSARTKLIDALVSDALSLGFDGINIDFEADATGYGGMDISCGVHFTQFLRELSIRCRQEGIILSVDNYVPAAYNQYYNRYEQGQIVDYVILMGYDEHYSGSEESGSVASYEFVKNGIEDTLEDVPASKLICAVPFYTRIWTVDENGAVLGSESIGASAMAQLIEELGLSSIWLEAEQQNFVEYELDGAFYQVWLEDEDSLEWKLELIESYELAGIAGWRLGLEPESFWTMISEALTD